MPAILDRPVPAPDARLAYGDHPAQVADLWLPGEGGPRPLVVALHGGWWRAAHDRAHLGHLCRALRDDGIAVLNVEYRRLGMPGVGLDAMLEDVAAALARARFLPDEHAILARPPLLLGHSAGGHLALCCAGAARALGVVALAPVSDLAFAAARALGEGAVDELVAGGGRSREETFARGSPMARLPIGVPQVVLHGVQDARVPLAMSEGYVAQARAAGDTVELRSLEGCDHFGVIDPANPAFEAVRAAVRERLGAGAP